MRRHGLGVLTCATTIIALTSLAGTALGAVSASGDFSPDPFPSDGVVAGETHLGFGVGSTGTITVTAGSELNTQERAFLGYLVGGTGNVTVTDASWLAQGGVFLASGAYCDATVQLTNSTWTAETNTRMAGDDFSTASITLDAGSSWNTEYGVIVAPGDDSAATIDINDGTWTAQARVTLSIDDFWDSLGTTNVTIDTNGLMDMQYGLVLGSLATISLDGGELRLAGETELYGSLNATANGGTVRAMVGQTPGGTGLVWLSEDVDFTNGDLVVQFHDGLWPAPSETFNVFDPLDEADLPTILGTAGTITTPQYWLLDHGTGSLYCTPFETCMNGVDVSASPDCQSAYDDNLDDDVDLADFVPYQRVYGG